MEYKINNFKEKIYQIEIDNGLGLTAILSNFGAGVYSLKLDGEPLILEFSDFQDYMYSAGFHGKTLGVVAGRLKGDGYIKGKEYHLKNDPDKNFSLHGGNQNSISYRPWKYSIRESNKKLSVIFRIATKNNENGFPGKANLTVTYEFSKTSNTFKIWFKATTPSEATFVNLSNHMYFNFNNSINLDDYYLKMNCDKVAITDPYLLITGVQDITKALDFRKSSKLSPRMDWIEKHDFKKTIDDTFIFDSDERRISLKGNEIQLNMKTDFTSMNIYVDNSLSGGKFINFEGNNLRRAIALEPQNFLLNEDEIVLTKDKVFKNYIEYKFKKVN